MDIVLPSVTDEQWESCSNFTSKSRIGQFDMCPIKYKKQYVDKTLGYQETHATIIGSRFHEFAEAFVPLCGNYHPSKWDMFISDDFDDEEQPMLKYFLEVEKERRAKGYIPIALEYRIVYPLYKIRGIIDRIDLIDDHTIEIVEYKTSKSISKQKLMLEFGFYSLLLDSIEELKDYDRQYIVIAPRVEKCYSFNASKKSTILGRLDKINTCIETGLWKPLCKDDYALPFCDICTLEEIAYYNVEWKGANE